MQSEKLSTGIIFGEAFNNAWSVFKKNWTFFVFGTLFVFVVQVILRTNLSNGFANLIWHLIGLIVGIIISIEVFNAINSALKNGNISFSSYSPLILQPGYSSIFVQYVIATILLTVIVLIGLIFLIIPGVILALMYAFTTYLVIDKKVDAFTAFKMSSELTKGNKWFILVMGASMVLLNLLGTMCLLVGLLVTVPLSYLIMIWVYRRLAYPQGENAVVENDVKSIDKGLNIN